MSAEEGVVVREMRETNALFVRVAVGGEMEERGEEEGDASGIYNLLKPRQLHDLPIIKNTPTN